MATCTPSARSSADVDDDALLLYLYEKSSHSRAKCFDCISMGGLAPESRDSSDEVAASDRELLSRSTDQICTKTLSSLVGSNTAAADQVPGVVRTCRSQENYFELSDMICVDIDIDENLASSVDALHYRDSVASRASDSSGSVEAVELETGDPVVPATTTDDKKSPDEQRCSDNLRSSEESSTVVGESRLSFSAALSEADVNTAGVDQQDGGFEDVATGLDDELQGRTCLKDADRPSAARLAKRLFYLDGFRKSAVSPHLSKKSVKLTSCNH